MLLAPLENPRPLLRPYYALSLHDGVQEALRYLAPPVTSYRVARRINRPLSAVWREMDRLVKVGQLVRVEDGYYLVSKVQG